MNPSETPRWLSPGEMDTWLSLWSVLEWLPVRLDAQLREDAGVSLAEYNALSQISIAPDASVRMSELAVVANMKLPHLSRVITRLEKAGWVRRIPDPADGRYTLAQLTDDGKIKVAAAAPGHVEAVRAYVFDGLSPEQVAALGAAAARIVEAVDAPGPAR
ncbi:MarR family winged helix-turn-helix transcriptional regulator [Corynebacterium comes]|uniref:DNA-binding transcriptional repressor MarR n=1 Tax=Corynebacterium comes TaxID=2675218 RepID=A0A6B8VTV5_9CORY|nr:MarR family transcriptional regulator [Corynebacterium comes]QGU03431.1 DNA-binding transcriptional repressor MarR [Corynebacterium comes]